MTKTELRADPRFAPYQKEFFDKFVSEVQPGSFHVLSAPIGSGKSFAVAATVSELRRTGRMQRVLLLVPAPLTVRWGSLLSRGGQEVVVVDARAIRVLRDQFGSTPDSWPVGLYVLSIDLAERSDVSELLIGAKWDLIVVDEAHTLSGQRLQLVNDLASKQHAPAFLLATHVAHVGMDRFTKRSRVFDWRDAVADFHGGQTKGAPPILMLETRTYRRSSDERSTIRDVIENAKQLGLPRGMVLLQRAASSISSLEDILLRWVEELDQGDDVRERLDNLLQRVEQVRSDSRLDCFRALLEELIVGGVRHILVFCEYRSTMDYLAAAIDNLEFTKYVLHEDMPHDQCEEIAGRFQSDGGVLITTAVATAGMSLSFVEAAIHYDLPLSPAEYAQREGRYRRYGRGVPCRVFCFEDETNAHPVEDFALRMVHKSTLVNEDLGVDLDGIFKETVKGL